MFCEEPMTDRQRFLNVMEYKPVDRVPNIEVGVWGRKILETLWRSGQEKDCQRKN
jgi:uroporphyrinogen-III decarboxylase